MKTYPSIDYYNKGYYNKEVIAFDKLDGSNFRTEFNRRSGFYKFGTRRILIDRSSEIYGKSIDIFLEKYNESLSKIFIDKYKKIDNFTVFGEFFGDKSFAGDHLDSDKMDVTIFDINLYKKGFIDPFEFVDNFNIAGIPAIIYEGKYTESFIKDVKENIFNLKEGVVCKGIISNRKSSEIWMTKIKTNNWLDRVREKFGKKYLIDELNGDISLI